MTQEEIIEGNKLIAAFIGAKWNGEYFEYEKGYRMRPDELCYHTSFDWLMPVVEKINNSMVGEMWFRTIIAPTQCDISVYAHGGMSVPMRQPRIHVGAKDKMIDAVYECVVKFIQWYNQQTKATIQ